MPDVSVIVPNYNHAKYLDRRLESILDQTYQDFELILLDDASTDNSLQVLDRYSKDPRARIYINKENSGSPFKQWNRGFDLAQGEHIWIAESDDYCDPRFLEKLTRALHENPDCGVAYCNSWLLKPDDEPVGLTPVRDWYLSFADHHRWEQDYRNDGKDELVNYLLYKNTIPNASAVVFSSSLLKGGLRAAENMRLTGDWLFWASVLLRTNLVFVAEPLNYYRHAHEESQRNKTEKDALELLEGLDIYRFIDQHLMLPDSAKSRHLKSQVKLWAQLTAKRGLKQGTNRQIRSKLLDVHPEAEPDTFRSIELPYAYYSLWFRFTASRFAETWTGEFVVRNLYRLRRILFGK